MSIYPEAISALTAEYAQKNEIDNESYSFQRMTTDLVLRQYNLLSEDLNDGDVDGYMDGGIDGFYIFVNGMYVSEDDKITSKSMQDNPKIEVYLIQNKYTNKFTEEAVLKLSNTAVRILNEADDMAGVKYSVRRKAKVFHAIWKKLISKIPSVKVNLLYITNADPDKPFESVFRLASQHSDDLRNRLYRSVEVNFELINSLNIYNRKKAGISYTKELVAKHRITTDSAEIITATLESYYNFITQVPVNGDPDSNRWEIAAHLFDDNVRDYQGDVTVNRNIATTLENADSNEFWWYNNGITIICSDATAKGMRLQLKDIQIVNGLQTSYCIYNAKASNPDIANYDNRHILIKIIITDDPTVRDSIIKATNSQTAINSWSLHATDRIQRLIEDYFKTKGLFYDRRKGYHKNNGQPSSKIVSINYVGQCMIAMGLSQPDTARARPNSFLSKEEQYKKVFDESIQLELYYIATTLQKRVESVIRAHPEYKEHYTDIRFHVSSFLCTRLAKHELKSPEQLARISSDMLSVDDTLICEAIEEAIRELEKQSASTGTDLARVAKSKDFRDAIVSAAIAAGRAG